MALVKYGGGIIQMSGSVAGNTHARNRFGNYIRAKTKPINPNTARQQQVRSAIALLTVRWAQTLTVDQRTAWNLYADNVNMKNRLGEVIHLSGFNHYIRSNATLAWGSLTIVDDGPVIFELPDADPSLAVSASEGDQQWTVTYDDALDWAAETGGYLWVYAGQPQNAQRNFFAGPWRWFTAVPGVDAAPPAGPLVSHSQWPIAEGQHLWIYCRILRKDGRLSERFRADCFCGA